MRFIWRNVIIFMKQIVLLCKRVLTQGKGSMKKRFLCMMTAGILAVSMLAGCGSAGGQVTAESLLQDVQKKCENMKSMETHTTAEITLDAEALGGTSMDMTMDMTMQTTTDPVANYMKGSIGILGATLDMEMYAIVEDDQICTYTGMADQWMVQKMDYDKDSMEKINAAAEDLLKSKDSLQLADETEEVDGTEAYIITGSISGEDVKNLMGSMESTLSSLTGGTDMNLDDISVEFTYAISKEDKMPLYMDMTFNGLAAGEGDEQVTFSKFNMKMEYTNYDTVEAITVPQEVIDSAVDVTEYMNELQNETSTETDTETETELQSAA